MRANIYSLEPLEPPVREAIHDGIGMVAAYIGETISDRELSIRVPLTPEGLVDTRRVGFGKLDILVELHLMAVPFKGDSETLGMASYGRGVGFVDTTSDYLQLIRTTTAHETAHSLGFVREDTEHKHPSSLHHCQNQNCLMHPSIATLIEESQIAAEQSRLAKLFHRPPKIATVRSTRLAQKQYDFCDDCKTDIYHEGSRQLQTLRHNRLFVDKKVTL